MLLPWKQLEVPIARHYARGRMGRPPYPLSAMPRVHVMQLVYNLSDPAMEDALYETGWAFGSGFISAFLITGSRIGAGVRQAGTWRLLIVEGSGGELSTGWGKGQLLCDLSAYNRHSV